MGLTPAQRQANRRARLKGVPEPYGAEYKAGLEEIASYGDEHARNLEWAKQFDASGKFYKAEARTCVELLGIYEGSTDCQEDDEEEAEKKAKKATKQVVANPSRMTLIIKAVEWNGIPIEPNCPDAEIKATKEVNEIVSFERWLDLRHKARTDLFWFGRMLGYGLYHGSHQVVCDKFVQKSFDGCYYPGYELDDYHNAMKSQVRVANFGDGSETGTVLTREMLLLEPRSSYKSTINMIDTLQWLINCPDIRIMFITAFKDLAKSFTKNVKAKLYLAPRGKPTAFQLLFPEYVLTGVDGRSDQPFETPARILQQPEPSVWFTSMESSSTGRHCDICKFDDAVDPKNSADEEMREELKFKLNGYNDVRDPWGFTDVCGTVYYTDDWYGTRLKPVDSDTTEVAPLLYWRRGSWILDALDQIAYNKGELTVAQIIKERRAALVHPYKLTWDELANILKKKGLRSFKNQQLNEATDAKVSDLYVNHFDEDVLTAHIINKLDAPKEGEIFQTWDWSYSDQKTSDYSVGVTGMVYKDSRGKYALCILEIIYDKWKSSELVLQMLSFYKKWSDKVQKILIEKANGADLLKDNLQNKSVVLGISEICNKIRWEPVDNSKKAKSNRVKSLEILLADNRLHFVAGPWLDETFKQLTRFNGEKSTGTRKDDIPDGMSFLVRFMPRIALMQDVDPKEAQKEAEQREAKARTQAAHAAMFGQNVTPPAVLASQITNRYVQQQSTTPVQTEVPADPRRAMLNKLFGGNGMRA